MEYCSFEFNDFAIYKVLACVCGPGNRYSGCHHRIGSIVSSLFLRYVKEMVCGSMGGMGVVYTEWCKHVIENLSFLSIKNF